MVLLVALVVWAIVDFYTMFNMLHSLFFSSGSWLFPYDSLLICALPEQFWMAMGVIWLVITVFLSIIFIIIGAKLRKRHPKPAKAKKVETTEIEPAQTYEAEYAEEY